MVLLGDQWLLRRGKRGKEGDASRGWDASKGPTGDAVRRFCTSPGMHVPSILHDPVLDCVCLGQAFLHSLSA